MNKKLIFPLAASLALIIAVACSPTAKPTAPAAPGQPSPASPGPGAPSSAGSNTINFVIGSENDPVMRNIVQPWFSSQKWTATYGILGSVDQKLLCETGKMVDNQGHAYNVMWPANKTWALICDEHKILVDNPSPAFYTPIVIAWPASGPIEALGWTGKAISLDDVVAQVKQGRQLWTSNLTQSNSGAVTAIALWNKVAGNDPSTPLTLEQVNNPAVISQVHDFYSLVNHGAASTAYVTNNCLAAPNCDMLVTYETLAIQHNLADPKNLLHVAYLADAFLYSDATPQFIQNGLPDDAAKKQMFDAFLKYMQTPEAEQKLIALGERPAQNGLRLDPNNPSIRSVFNPDWGIQPTIKIQPITLPEGPVLEQLFYNYQTSARPAYDLVEVLDRSGSMRDSGKWDELIKGLGYITDKDQATNYQLLANPGDLTTFITFSGQVDYVSPTVTGDDYAAFAGIYNKIKADSTGSTTDIFGALNKALDVFGQHPQVESRKHLLILMTDGIQNASSTINSYLQRWKSVSNLKVIAVGIGPDVDVDQLHQIVDPMQGLVILTDPNFKPSKWNEAKASGILDAIRQTVGSK